MQMISMIKSLVKVHMGKTPVMIFLVQKAADKEKIYD